MSITRLFHISDILSATTERLVSVGGMKGVQRFLSFVIGEEVFTHQMPQVMDDCRSHLQAQFPGLMKNNPFMARMISGLDRSLNQVEPSDREAAVARWVEAVRLQNGMEEYLPVRQTDEEQQRRHKLDTRQLMAGAEFWSGGKR